MTEEQNEKPELTLIEGGSENTTAPDIDGAFLGGRIFYEENKVVFDDGTTLPYKTDELPEGFTIDETLEVTAPGDVSFSEGTVKVPTQEEMIGSLIQEVSFALMRWWFPNRLPVGEDYQRWVEISLKDAEAVVTHLIKAGIIRLESINGN